MLEAPDEGELQVVHLHGLPGTPSSLVLPGRSTNALLSDTVFERFLSATMAPANVLYLGFSFGLAELHLRSLLAWLSTEVDGAAEHFLLLSAEEVRARADDMALFAGFGMVDVVGYEADAAHSAVERVALALAPRTALGGDGRRSGRSEPTWVQPVMVRGEGGEDREGLQQRIAGFDYGWAGGEAVAGTEQVLDAGRAIVIAAPGMGKSTLMRWLPAIANRDLCARGELGEFSPPRTGAAPEDAIARVLRRVEDGERIAVEDLRGGEAVLLLDGLDEVEEEVRDQAVAAISSAVACWPGHVWVVTSRPCDAATALAADGFAAFHILPSRRWARKYLETRSVPQDRVERAMLDGYGLGDLLGVPLFAERLADRLLDDDEEGWSPLELLISEQYAAIQREARKQGQTVADLGSWMRSLAVALELRGRSSASIDELAAVLGPGGLAASEARRRLVDVALLADAPGVVAFPLKTLQEGVCAEAILSARDPVAQLSYAAIAEVAGSKRLRDDFDFVADLVFEHADRDVRRTLMDIGPLRWARTVVTRGDEADAGEAFEILWQWHAAGDWSFGGFGESGLRTSRQAVVAIARRWPQIIRARREELEGETAGDSPAARARALTVLGQLPADEKTDGWLLPRLTDSDPQVAILACQIAGQLRATSAEGALRGLLDSDHDRLARAALMALVEIVEVASLAEVGEKASARNRLQPIAERLLERLDLDTGIEMVTRSSNVDSATPSIMQRLLETAHADAWTEKRVSTLMLACRTFGVGAMPDVDLLAGVFSRHPAAAIAAVRIQPISGGPYGPAGQLLPLSRLDADLLAGEEHVELSEAIDRAVRESADWEARSQQHERERERLEALLGERGLELDPSELDPSFGSIRKLPPKHRRLLGELVNRWWPNTGLAISRDEALDERPRIMLLLGADISAPLTAARWRELLDAHLGAGPFGSFELANEGILSWLIDTYDGDYEQEIFTRIDDAADALALRKLVAIPGRGERTPQLIGLALDRLTVLGDDTSGWLSLATVLIEGGHTEDARALLEGAIPEETRNGLLARLAMRGDPLARVMVLEELTAEVERGESPDRPQWRESTPTPEVVAASARLADFALTHAVEELPGFALALMQAHPDEETLRLLTDLADRHGETARWLPLSVIQMARRIATRDVLDRLPGALDEIAASFDAQAMR